MPTMKGKGVDTISLHMGINGQLEKENNFKI